MVGGRGNGDLPGHAVVRRRVGRSLEGHCPAAALRPEPQRTVVEPSSIDLSRFTFGIGRADGLLRIDRGGIVLGLSAPRRQGAMDAPGGSPPPVRPAAGSAAAEAAVPPLPVVVRPPRPIPGRRPVPPIADRATRRRAKAGQGFEGKAGAQAGRPRDDHVRAVECPGRSNGAVLGWLKQRTGGATGVFRISPHSSARPMTPSSRRP